MNRATFANARLLLVESDPSPHGSPARILARHGEIVTARDESEALARANDGGPWKGFFIDLDLLAAGGIELLRRLREAHGLTPAAALSRGINPTTINAASALGAHYFLKPIEDDALDRFLSQTCSLDFRVARTTRSWTATYGLTGAEADVLRRCALGESREAIVAARGTTTLTLQKQVSNLLRRTLDDSLQAAAARLLRDAVAM